MTITQRLAVAALASLALASCGSSDATPEASASSTAAGAIASAASGKDVSINTGELPDFVEMYSGGKAVMSMAIADEGNLGGSFSYTVAAPADKVIAFHKQSLLVNEIPLQVEMRTEESATIGGESLDKQRSLMVQISSGEDGLTSVTMTHSRPAG